MLRLTTAGATAFALLAFPALAQEAAPDAAGDSPETAQSPQESAMQSAEAAGMVGVEPVDGAFVLQGDTAAGMPVMMVVGPDGDLLALAAPTAALGGAGAAGGEPLAGDATGGQGEAAEPVPGEPAQSGFMATQADPAAPGMWDPASVQAAIRSLELGMRGMAGQVSEPEPTPQQ